MTTVMHNIHSAIGCHNQVLNKYNHFLDSVLQSKGVDFFVCFAVFSG